VIDDAIVVLESIYRKLEAGDEPMLAAQRGARGVGLAVVSTTLAVCAVFLPIVFMQSTIGCYFYEFGIAVTVAVCVSTLVALTLTPMLASRMLRVKRASRGRSSARWSAGCTASTRATAGCSPLRCATEPSRSWEA